MPQSIDVYIGSDHAGYELKAKIEDHLRENGYKPIDLGVFGIENSADYPDIAREVGEKVSENKSSFGLLICGTGVGMCMAANKVKGIRAANTESELSTQMSREHNDANILCLGGRIVDLERATRLVDVFLKTPFSGDERHTRRIAKIAGIEAK
ncbi:MAG: ribose 5-phosphate isomerase B [Patescibacteria group bacterium]